MGSGDLNMKKSWHPQRSGNVAATQKAEAEAIAERKKLQQRLQEIEEERRKEEIQKALEAAGGKRKIDRVEWMYSGPTDGQAGDSAETEAYLLGKRRIDKLLQDNDTKKALSKQPQQDLLSAAGPAPVVTNARDVATKIREDPLLAIKRQEQQAYEAMMNDPIKRRQLLASMGIDDSQIAKKDGKEERRHKHRSHHHRSDRHRDRNDDRDRERDRDRDRHSRRRRPDSQDRSRSRSPRRRSDSEEDRSKRRRRDSPDRTKRRDQDESRSRGNRDRDDSRSRRHRSKDRSRSRSRSPGGRSSRRREYSRERGESGPSSRRDDRNNRDQNRPPRRDYTNKEDDRPRYNGGLNKGGRQQPQHQPDGDNKKAEEERAKKLAAMQAAATDLDKAREERLKALAEAERAEREADEKARQQNKKYRGGDAGFMSNLHSRAADMKIADRMNGRV